MEKMEQKSMPKSNEMIIEFVCKFSEQHHLKVAVKESFLGGVVAGFATSLGGLLVGPVGLVFGATIGGILAWCLSRGKLKPAVVVIRSMEPQKEAKLIKDISPFVKHLDLTDTNKVVSIIKEDPDLEKKILEKLTEFFKKVMQMNAKQMLGT